MWLNANLLAHMDNSLCCCYLFCCEVWLRFGLGSKWLEQHFYELMYWHRSTFRNPSFFSIVLYFKYVFHFKKVVALLNSICQGLFPPISVIYLLAHINSSHPVPLRLQVTCGTSLWESSSCICQLFVIEWEGDRLQTQLQFSWYCNPCKCRLECSLCGLMLHKKRPYPDHPYP